MADRRLVVTDADSTSADYGKMFALDSSHASAVALPAFKIATTLPAVGTTVGEAIFNSTDSNTYVWTGSAWTKMTPSPIRTYPTDTQLLADLGPPSGSYAISQSTGNVYARATAGWVRVGMAHYSTTANLLADAPPIGTFAAADDEPGLWERTTLGWRILTTRELANTAAVSAWAATPVQAVTQLTITTPAAAAVGTEVVAATINGTAVRITATAGNTAAQVAEAFKVAAQAAIPTLTFSHAATSAVVGILGLANGTPIVVTATTNVTVASPTPGKPRAAFGVNVGDQALALDTDVTYVRTTQGWRPTSVFADTEANIRAVTWALNGQEAIATDTDRRFVFVKQGAAAGVWREEPIQHYTTDALLRAATPPDGTLAWADDSRAVYARAGGAWVGMNTGFWDPIPVGTIMAFPTQSVPLGWLRCDGSAIPAGNQYNALRTLLGTTTVPDLRGQFLRGGTAADTLLGKVQWTTGAPRNNQFTTTNNGSHTHNIWGRRMSNYSGHGYSSVPQTFHEGIDAGGAVNTDGRFMDADGGHQHNVTGGDTETAPDHVKIVYCIKASHVEVASVSAPFIANNPADGQVIVYNATTGSWTNGPVPAKVTTRVLTQAAYDAIGTKDPNTLYLISA
jgi:hypothetical protein